MDDGVPLKLGLALQFDENSDSDDEIPILDMEEDDLKVTKKQLCREIAKRLPGIASRIQRLAEEKRKAEDAKEAQRKKTLKPRQKGGMGRKNDYDQRAMRVIMLWMEHHVYGWSILIILQYSSILK